MKPIEQLEKALKHQFSNRELLVQALTHSSLARERESQGAGPQRDNEQLEFLGDAVLSLAASLALIDRYPAYSEGQLSKLRAHLVSARHLARAAGRLKLGEHLQLGRGEERSGGREKLTLQTDALEAVLAALYLDADFAAVQAVVGRLIVDPEIKRLGATLAEGLSLHDFKSALQEAAQASGRPQPTYHLVRADGPEHERKFTMEVRVLPPGLPAGEKPEFIRRGRGGTKKAAEQDAARKALELLRAATEAPAERTAGADQP